MQTLDWTGKGPHSTYFPPMKLSKWHMNSNTTPAACPEVVMGFGFYATVCKHGMPQDTRSEKRKNSTSRMTLQGEGFPDVPFCHMMKTLQATLSHLGLWPQHWAQEVPENAVFVSFVVLSPRRALNFDA